MTWVFGLHYLHWSVLEYTLYLEGQVLSLETLFVVVTAALNELEAISKSNVSEGGRCCLLL